MRVKRLVGISALVIGMAALSACAPQSSDGNVESTQRATVNQVGLDAVDEAGTCVAFGDVLTILENADVSLAQGRMETQEHEGWYQLATRVLDRIPADGDGTIHQAVKDLKAAAPAAPAGGYTETTGFGSSDWNAALDVLGSACDKLDHPLAMSMFTGG